MVSDVATGLDEVGIISNPKRIDVHRKAFLATIQTFRGGSNSARVSRVV